MDQLLRAVHQSGQVINRSGGHHKFPKSKHLTLLVQGPKRIQSVHIDPPSDLQTTYAIDMKLTP